MFEQGTYLGRINKWGLSAAKTGTPQFFVTFTPLGRVDPSKPDDTENLIACEDWERTIFRAITENTIDFVVRDLKALGYSKDTFDQLDPEHKDAHSFADMEIRVTCKHEEYQGKNKERWDFAFGDGFKPKEMEAGGVKKLNALFGKKLKEVVKAPSKTEKEAANKKASDDMKKEAAEVF